MASSSSSSLIVGVSILGLFNVSFLFYQMSKNSWYVPQSASDCILNAATEFLQSNGNMLVKDALKKNCKVVSADKKFSDVLRRTLEESILDCNANLKRHILKDADDTLLTLFTTWPTGDDKRNIHENTAINWSSFIPKVNVVLFTNDTKDKSMATDRGWVVFPIIHQPKGKSPVLRTMFETVKQKFNSSFYGYANANILFDDSLIDSLFSVLSRFKKSDEIFITGQRLSVNNVTQKDLASLSNIKSAAKSRDASFEEGESYFISTKSFSWNSTPEVVTGDSGYGRLFVSHATHLGAIVIDTTGTVFAAYQNGSIGTYKAHSEDLVKQSINSFESGSVNCTAWFSYETLCGDIGIGKREKLPPVCRTKL